MYILKLIGRAAIDLQIKSALFTNEQKYSLSDLRIDLCLCERAFFLDEVKGLEGAAEAVGAMEVEVEAAAMEVELEAAADVEAAPGGAWSWAGATTPLLTYTRTTI